MSVESFFQFFRREAYKDKVNWKTLRRVMDSNDRPNEEKDRVIRTQEDFISAHDRQRVERVLSRSWPSLEQIADGNDAPKWLAELERKEDLWFKSLSKEERNLLYNKAAFVAGSPHMKDVWQDERVFSLGSELSNSEWDIKTNPPDDDVVKRCLADIYGFIGYALPQEIIWKGDLQAAFEEVRRSHYSSPADVCATSGDNTESQAFVKAYMRWFRHDQNVQLSLIDCQPEVVARKNWQFNLHRLIVVDVKYTTDLVVNPQQPIENLIREIGCSGCIFETGSIASWVWMFYSYYAQMREEYRKFAPLVELSKQAAFWMLFPKVAILVKNPIEVHFDQGRSLHSLSGPALKWDSYPSNADHDAIYAYHGITVPPKVILKDYNVDDILKENNVELRRIMVEIYGGMQRVFEDVGLPKVDESSDYGTLYKVRFAEQGPALPAAAFISRRLDGFGIKLNSEAALAVRLCELTAARSGIWRPEDFAVLRVLNSTPEPDGTYREYFLRVDPRCQTAEEAWFSLHRLLPSAGRPVLET